MRPTVHSPSDLQERGFTLIEMVVVIAITGILAAIVAVFIRRPMEGMMETVRRAALADVADTTLRRMQRDIRRALPNSVRITSLGSNWFVEFIPTLDGGRYCDAGTTTPVCTPLSFTAASTSFSNVGPAMTFVAGSSVVVYNLGQTITGADAYAGANRAAISSITGNLISISSTSFTLPSPDYRFQIVSTPVSYAYNQVAGTLTRYAGYGWNSAQPITFGSGTSALLASHVSAFLPDLTQSAVDQNAILLLTIQLNDSSVSANNETVSLTHEIQINNTP